MLDAREVGLHGLTDCIIAHLKVTEPFCCHAVGPVDTLLIVVVYVDWL